MSNSRVLSTLPASGLVFRNKIINGDMKIDQRNSGGSYAVPAGGGYSVDRWHCEASQASKYTAQQSSSAPAGFVNSLKLTSSSAYSLSAGDYFQLQQSIEGFNTSDLNWGTSNAKTVTLSFWVNASVTGTYGMFLINNASSRIYPTSYTVNSANTWEQKTITVLGDTTGTWETTNSKGIRIAWTLGYGSTYTGATSNAWAGGSLYVPSGCVNFMGTNGATFYITGVQLEKGSVATPYEVLAYQVQLAQCQRYYHNNFYGTQVTFWNSSLVGTWPRFPVPMRANPTVNLISGSNISVDVFGLGPTTFTITNADTQSPYGCRIYGPPANTQATGITGHISSYNIQASAEL